MSRKHPYLGMPDYQFWKNEPGIVEPGRFDPIIHPSFSIAKSEPVVTAGSCFAQHVAKRLANSGFCFLVTEKMHPLVPPIVAEPFNYGVFSARYGNLYTARQLKQLLQRAYGLFEPAAVSWTGAHGSVVDPFRPQIQKGGFISEADLVVDRQHHFGCVREAVETMSVFVFTLGLTESWIDKRDGAVFPLAPGVAGGEFDPELYAFHNFDVDETTSDLEWSLEFIRQKKPDVKFIITVSPVPLNATALDRHVFVSTTYSKSVLRVAAEEVCSTFWSCDYFPSFEIITSPYVRGQYFGTDCRDVTEAGVSHVMSLFFKHYGDITCDADVVADDGETEVTEAMAHHLQQMEEAMQVLCDEEVISNR